MIREMNTVLHRGDEVQVTWRVGCDRERMRTDKRRYRM
jgi:hypothetical protein